VALKGSTRGGAACFYFKINDGRKRLLVSLQLVLPEMAYVTHGKSLHPPLAGEL
jgi:hypothetical protein